MNSCTFTGRLSKDIELRFSQDNKAVGKTTIAVDTGFGDNKKTAWVNLVMFGKTAENMEKYLKKGQKVLVTATYQTGSYKNKEGKTVYTNDFLVNSFEFIEPKGVPYNGQDLHRGEATADNSFVDVPEGTDAELPFN